MKRTKVQGRGVVCGVGGFGLAVWLLPAWLFACGPWFPNTILEDPGCALRTMPEADFAAELDLLQRELLRSGTLGRTNWPASAFACDDPDEETILADLSDLETALGPAPASAGTRAASMADYEVFRVCLVQLDGVNMTGIPGPLPDLEPPAGLPKEFELYARGAVAYRRHDLPTARRYWIELLALPPAERRFRSVWGAYMLGRSWQEEQPVRAVDCFRMARNLAAASCHDSLGLARASLGWEARAELARQSYESAALLYLTQYAAGNGNASWSLCHVARGLVTREDYRFPEFAASPVLRSLITAYLVSRVRSPEEDQALPAGESADHWLAAVREAGVRNLAGADRLAWLAYRRGQPEVAQRWLDCAPPHSITTRWLTAKLLLRQGRRKEAEALLDGVTRDIDAAPRDTLPSFAATDVSAGDWPASLPAGELAALLMSDGRYRDAFDLLVRHGWKTDAVYVGERVLTLDELRGYVDENFPAAETTSKPGLQSRGDEVRDRAAEVATTLRYLLARRLARAGELSASIGYFPSPWRGWMEEYQRKLAIGRDARFAVATRAAALWRAARIARARGMDLFGTEVSPDWRLYGGAYELGYVEDRLSTNQDRAAFVGTDEVARVERHAPRIGKRYHYRYLAADLAWEAVGLMPDRSPLTARMLCEAGSWLKDRDPTSADRFYKALARRCGTTALGQEARQKRWFPRAPEGDAPLFPPLAGD